MSALTSPRRPNLSMPIGGYWSSPALQPVAWPIQLAFYIFVFSIPFEGYDPWGIRGVFTITKMAAYVFVLLSVFQISTCLRWLPKVLFCFWTFLVVYTFRELFNDSEPFSGLYLVFMLFQLIFLFWISANLLERPEVAKRTLFVLSSACALLALLTVLGVTAEADEGVGRVTALGMDENYIGLICLLGALTFLGLAHGRHIGSNSWNLVLWAPVILLFWQIVATGSRTAMFATPLAAAMIILKKGRISARLGALFVVGLAAMAFVLVILQSEIATERWEAAVEEKSLSGREQIYPTAAAMFLESPFVGWGRTASTYELGRRLGHYGSTGPHNELLSHLLSGGLVQTLPLVIGVWLCLRGAWRARGGPLGAIPLALLVAVLIVSMAIDVHHRKVTWLVLAMGYASGRSVRT